MRKKSQVNEEINKSRIIAFRPYYKVFLMLDWSKILTWYKTGPVKMSG